MRGGGGWSGCFSLFAGAKDPKWGKCYNAALRAIYQSEASLFKALAPPAADTSEVPAELMQARPPPPPQTNKHINCWCGGGGGGSSFICLQAMSFACRKYGADRSRLLIWIACNDNWNLRCFLGIARLFVQLRFMDKIQLADAKTIVEAFGRTASEPPSPPPPPPPLHQSRFTATTTTNSNNTHLCINPGFPPPPPPLPRPPPPWWWWWCWVG